MTHFLKTPTVQKDWFLYIILADKTTTKYLTKCNSYTYAVILSNVSTKFSRYK